MCVCAVFPPQIKGGYLEKEDEKLDEKYGRVARLRAQLYRRLSATAELLQLFKEYDQLAWRLPVDDTHANALWAQWLERTQHNQAIIQMHVGRMREAVHQVDDMLLTLADIIAHGRGQGQQEPQLSERAGAVQVLLQGKRKEYERRLQSAMAQLSRGDALIPLGVERQAGVDEMQHVNRQLLHIIATAAAAPVISSNMDGDEEEEPVVEYQQQPAAHAPPLMMIMPLYLARKMGAVVQDGGEPEAASCPTCYAPIANEDDVGMHTACKHVFCPQCCPLILRKCVMCSA